MDESRKPKILVTGGTGKIGSHFVRYASDRYFIRVVDKDAWDSQTQGDFAGESLVLDLQDLDACRAACSGMDQVIHLAADASPDADFIDSLLANNILATYNMFRAAKEASCKRFIFASSVHAVDAYPPDVQVKADMPVRPNDLYGVSKCFGEALAAYFALNEGLPSIALRIGGYISPEDYQYIKPKEYPIFLDPDDFNQLLIRCLETPDITFLLTQAISDNLFKRLDITEARQVLGYEPRADSFKIFKVFSENEDTA
jgi:nucleoside-diphosphate-sugar epimerase